MLYSSFLCFATLTLVLSNPLAVLADDAQILAKIDEQLSQIKSFEFNQGGNVPQGLEQTIFKLPTNSPLREAIESKLIDALQEANPVGRGIICRQLRVVGTDKCIAAISEYLGDAETSSFARYTLQGIGTEKALAAMHDALGKAPLELQIGILNSLSARKYRPMLEDCVERLESANLDLAASAARALGRLGGESSVDALKSRRPNASSGLAGAIDVALLSCAEQLVAAGSPDQAGEIYSTVFESDGPFRAAGLRGLIAAKQERAVDLVVAAMRAEDATLAATAANLVEEIKGENASEKFVGALRNVPDSIKVLLVKSLGRRGGRTIVPAIAEAADSEVIEIRLAAIEALGGLQGNEAVNTLLQAALDRDAAVQRIALFSLARVKNAGLFLQNAAKEGNEETRVIAIETLAVRKHLPSAAMMFSLAKSKQLPIRTAAIKACGYLADVSNVDKLIELGASTNQDEDLTEIETALGRVLGRIHETTERSRILLGALSNAKGVWSPILIRQLSKAGDRDALAAVRSALGSAHDSIQVAAIEALASWPNDSALRDLIPLVESAPTKELKATALNGYIRIAANSESPAALFLTLLESCKSLENKKLVLNEIGLNCESFEAIESTKALFSNRQLQATAAIAAIRIAYKLRQKDKDRVRAILLNVLASVSHPDVQARGQNVLNDIDKYEDHILEWVAIGPFVDPKITSGEASFNAVFEPEQRNTSSLKWEPLTKGIGSWDINLEAAYGAKDHCSAFVRTMVWSPVKQKVQVEGGSDDALKIWLNGELIHQKWRTGGCKPRDVQAAATLQKGWNELKLKVTDHGGGWQFGCRVRKPNGTLLEGLKYEAR
ncbi:MAG: HEAT repeat domain-containing protein [Planctomycetota bacterium]